MMMQVSRYFFVFLILSFALPIRDSFSSRSIETISLEQENQKFRCQSLAALPETLKRKQNAFALERQNIFALEKKASYKTYKDGFHSEKFQQWLKNSNISSRDKPFVKNLFLILVKQNQNIAEERQCVKACMLLKHNKKPLPIEYQKKLSFLKEKYRTSHLNDLLNRIDMIPPSIAIAQAIEESGWGRAPIARKKCSFFGMRSKGKLICYKDESSCVDHYLTNLNRHKAYQKLRLLRQKLRLGKKSIKGPSLVPGLTAYCTYKNYLSRIQMIIRTYRLDMLDDIIAKQL